jgi:hypothetical protein
MSHELYQASSDLELAEPKLCRQSMECSPSFVILTSMYPVVLQSDQCRLGDDANTVVNPREDPMISRASLAVKYVSNILGSRLYN